MSTLYTQLNFGGNCEAAFRFYERELGGKVVMIFRQSDAPGAPGDASDAVIHARLQLGGTLLIGNDVPPARFKPMRSAYLFYSVDSTAEAERVYALLSDGGEVFMPLEETFFATRFAMVRDRFGVSWSIVHEKPRG